MRIAIVGAGIAGLSCAEVLQSVGHTVTLFDKGRSAGGRMSTRQAAAQSGFVSFDYGAQYFTARDREFCGMVASWEAEGIITPWPAAGDDAWVGTPGMNALVQAIAGDLDVRWNAGVVAIRQEGRSWFVDPIVVDGFDAVIVATPAEQAARLLAPHDAALTAIAASCRSAPCWTAMVAFDATLSLSRDLVRDVGIIGWAARNSAKPGRGGLEAWVIQATADWSRVHLENDPANVVDTLLSALAAHATRTPPPTIVKIGHRWRYARVVATSSIRGPLWNEADRIGAVGDWLIAPRVESAWLSGRELAKRIVATRA